MITARSQSSFRTNILVALFATLALSCDDEIPVLELVEVTGIVQEANSLQPIPAVTVTILEQENISPQLTGTNGSFRFSDLRLDDGTYELEVSSDDYVNEKTVFTIENGKQTDSLTIRLLASEVLTFDQSVLDFGSVTDEIELEITNTSSSTQSFSISADVPWLSFSEDELSLGSEASSTITITVDRSNAEVGTYEESIQFEVEGRPSQTLVVKMQKLDPTSGILTLNNTSLDFGKASESQSIRLSNTGQSTLNWTATSADSWLSISTTNGSVEPDEDVDLSISVNRDDLANGMYESTVSFGGDGGTATLIVNMEVDNSVGLLQLSTSSLDFGLENESSQITLTNDGTSSLEWSATVNDNWISLDVTSGSLDIGANTTATVTVDRSLLAAGTYEGSIDFSSNDEISTLSIALEVQGGILTISETTLNMGSAEDNRTIEFSNVGMRPLSWTSDETTSWLNIAPKEGSLAVGSSATILIEVDRLGLGLGDYNASIQITSEGENFAIAVTMSVAQDTDMDGVPDEVDADFDGDGLMEVFTINDLDAIRNDLNATGDGKQGAPSGGFTGYELMNDLDFNDDNSYSDLNLKSSVTSGSGWEPIGNSSNPFSTLFDGNDFTISNLLIDRSSSGNGLFAEANIQATLRNIHIQIRSFNGGNTSGGLLGANDRGTVQNCSVIGIIAGNSTTGGLVGDNEGTILNSWTEGDVSGSVYVGGLTGRNRGDGEIEFSYSTMNVQNDGNYSGGLTGQNLASVKMCYAKGNVNAGGNWVGGLIGSNQSSEVQSCYAMGNVSTSAGTVGGMVGWNNSPIFTSFSIGTVTGSSTVGGFVGLQSTISDANYWDIETSGITESGGGTGQTTSSLQATTSAVGIYVTWSSDVWDFGTSTQYPALKNMPNGLSAQRD